MSEIENGKGGVRVNDRRRIDADGNSLFAEEPGPPQGPPPPPEGKLAALETDNAQLREQLEGAHKRVDELARAFQSLQQDREEFKARLTRERERMMDVERGNVATTLLEVIDDLDRCLLARESDRSPLSQGVRLIREKLLSKLQAAGIERMTLIGQRYDPNVAEATDIEVTATPEEDQTVVAEIDAGYKLKDRVIRPARVKVAKYVKPAQA